MAQVIRFDVFLGPAHGGPDPFGGTKQVNQPMKNAMSDPVEMNAAKLASFLFGEVKPTDSLTATELVSCVRPVKKKMFVIVGPPDRDSSQDYVVRFNERFTRSCFLFLHHSLRVMRRRKPGKLKEIMVGYPAAKRLFEMVQE
jgi:hypothetical protein